MNKYTEKILSVCDRFHGQLVKELSDRELLVASQSYIKTPSFEEFYDSQCRVHANVARLSFYLGSALMLVAVAVMLSCQLLYKFNEYSAAAVFSSTCVLSIFLGFLYLNFMNTPEEFSVVEPEEDSFTPPPGEQQPLSYQTERFTEKAGGAEKCHA